jgi:hypothetical protein
MNNGTKGSSIRMILVGLFLLLSYFGTVQIMVHHHRCHQHPSLSFTTATETSLAFWSPLPQQQQQQQVVVPSMSLALEQSFGFFDDITDEDWKLRQQKARTHQHHKGRNPLRYWGKRHEAFMYYFYHYEPLFSCPHVHRVGGAGDGPKWTCDPHRIQRVVQRRNVTCLVYSIGSFNIYLWEDGLYDLLGPDVCEYHIFDPGHYDRPTINPQRNMHYHMWGITSSYHNDTRSHVMDTTGPLRNGNFKTFPETLRLLGHEHRTVDLLKVDCEFCEWFTYRDFIQYGDVRQLMIETHHVPLPETMPAVWPWPGTTLTPNQFFDDLQKAGFIMFSKEPNIHRKGKVRRVRESNEGVYRWACTNDVVIFCSETSLVLWYYRYQGNLVEWSFIKLHSDFLNST